ncbi:helix-turn-helix transcriptional regulator [Marisediminitalea sp.]|uniref:helix-turn-helix transcriptional regulator n=1 Tax=Marisediminitalea sp. TaxID=2662268 RepID=UPI003513B73C
MNVNETRILLKPEIKAATGLSNTSLHCYINAGLIPPYIKLGSRSVGLMKFEVDAIMAARAAGHSDDQIRNLVEKLVEKRRAEASAIFESVAV